MGGSTRFSAYWIKVNRYLYKYRRPFFFPSPADRTKRSSHLSIGCQFLCVKMRWFKCLITYWLWAMDWYNWINNKGIPYIYICHGQRRWWQHTHRFNSPIVCVLCKSWPSSYIHYRQPNNCCWCWFAMLTSGQHWLEIDELELHPVLSLYIYI